jgi:dinuclear metal center YbgI/SA1388 family protein
LTTLAEVMEALGELFPWELAADRDGSGLLIGSLQAEVRRVMCSIEATSDRVQAALDAGCELLIVHHPHLLGPAASPWSVQYGAGGSAGRATAGGLNVVGCHGNADTAAGGAGDLMARHLGVEVMGPLEPAEDVYIAKLVVFIPPEAVEPVSAAMAGAGAGVIGEYTHCGFRVSGRGTFVPGAEARPYTGKPAVFNVHDEVRLEMVAPSFRIPVVVDAMLDKHPYQQVAYDIYRTENPVPWGIGRLGYLVEARKLCEIMEDLAGWCASHRASLTGEPQRSVKKVAVVPGYAGTRVRHACAAAAEVLITGEAGWHGEVEAGESGMALITLGHLESERPLVPRMVEGLREASEKRSLGIEVEGYRDDEGRWG